MKKLIIGLVVLSAGVAMLCVLFSLKTVVAAGPAEYECLNYWDFSSPSGFGIDKSDNLWIAESDTKVLQILHPLSGIKNDWQCTNDPNNPSEAFYNPFDVAVDYAAGNVFFTAMYPKQTGKKKFRLIKANSKGDYQWEAVISTDYSPKNIALDNKDLNIYMIGISELNGKGERILRLNAKTGEQEYPWNSINWGGWNAGKDFLINATGIAADDTYKKLIYVVDQLAKDNSEKCIRVFKTESPGEKHTLKFSGNPPTKSKGIELDSAGTIYMIDGGKSEMLKIVRDSIPDADGFITPIKRYKLDKKFKEATDLVVTGGTDDDNLTIFVLDRPDNKIYKFVHYTKMPGFKPILEIQTKPIVKDPQLGPISPKSFTIPKYPPSTLKRKKSDKN